MIYDSGPSRGGKWGEALGQSISSVLGGLAQGKANQLQHRSLTQALQSQGIKNPSAAAQLLLLDNKAGLGMLQHGYGEEARSLERQKEERKLEEARSLGSIVNSAFGNPNSNQPVAGKYGLPQATPAKQPVANTPVTQGIKPGPTTQEATLPAASANPAQAFGKAAVKQPDFSQSGISPANANVLLKAADLKNKERKFNYDVGQDTKKFNQTEEHFNKTHELKSKKDKREETKEAKDWRDGYAKKAKASKENLRNYEVIAKLANNPELRSGPQAIALDKLGLKGFFTNPTTEVIEKAMAHLATNVGDAFGGQARVTNFLESVFQKTLPTIWNSARGIKILTKFNKYIDEANVVRDKYAQKYLKENKGVIGHDADDIVNYWAEPELEKLEQKAFQAAFSATLPDPVKYKPNSRIKKDGYIWGIKNGDWEILEDLRESNE